MKNSDYENILYNIITIILYVIWVYIKRLIKTNKQDEIILNIYLTDLNVTYSIY